MFIRRLQVRVRGLKGERECIPVATSSLLVEATLYGLHKLAACGYGKTNAGSVGN